MSAARWRPPSSAMPRRSNTCRRPPSSASPRCSRARSMSGAQYDRHPDARHRARPRFHRRQLSMTARASWCEQEARREERQGAERRHDLRAAGHDDRAQPRRLLPQQQDDLQAGRHREGRGSARRLLLRPLRRLHDRRLGPLLDPRRQRPQPGRLHRPAGDHLQGAAGAGGAPRRQPVRRHRALVAVRHARGRGIRHQLQDRGRDAEERRSRRSSASSA